MLTDPGKVMVAISAFAAAWGTVAVIARAVIRYAELHAGNGRPGLSGDTDKRLERIEQAMDAIAIEVERISEAQRFTTKLLAERAEQPERRERLPS